MSGYWQILRDETSRERTAFTAFSGFYEFKTVLFGLCNAPATFQRLMEALLCSQFGKVCLTYLDNVVIFSKSFEEHLQYSKS